MNGCWSLVDNTRVQSDPILANCIHVTILAIETSDKQYDLIYSGSQSNKFK